MPLSTLEHQLCQHIASRGEALLADLRLHVGIPTGGRNVPALDRTRAMFVERARALGAAYTLVPGEPRPDWLYGDEPNQAPLPTAICRCPGSGREVLIAGHLDTVHDPAGAFQELSISADGTTASGPGCVDMKGGLVIAIAALEALHAVMPASQRPSWTLLLNSDEETGSYHSARAIADEAARVHAAGGVGIAIEPATPEGGLVVERAGSGQFVIDAYGKAAHVGRDFTKGVSAVLLLARATLEVQDLSRPSEQIIVNIGPLRGGTATNAVPDHAQAWGNVRFPTRQAAAELQLAFASITAKLSTAPVGQPGSLRVRTSFARDAKPLTDATRAFAELVRGVAGELGQPLPFTTTAGVCDGNIMQSVGLPTLDTLGVRGGGLHTPQEWIELPSLVERCQLLALTILRCSGDKS